jgi:putative membrane protein
VTAKEGASFGLMLMTLTHETSLPAMGLAESPEEQTPREHTSEMATHLLFGMVAERVRSLVRGWLG